MVILLCSIARCIIFGVIRLPVRPCDERPPAMYGHFCLVPRVSIHDRYYCSMVDHILHLSMRSPVYIDICLDVSVHGILENALLLFQFETYNLSSVI